MFGLGQPARELQPAADLGWDRQWFFVREDAGHPATDFVSQGRVTASQMNSQVLRLSFRDRHRFRQSRNGFLDLVFLLVQHLELGNDFL